MQFINVFIGFIKHLQGRLTLEPVVLNVNAALITRMICRSVGFFQAAPAAASQSQSLFRLRFRTWKFNGLARMNNQLSSMVRNCRQQSKYKLARRSSRGFHLLKLSSASEPAKFLS